MNPIHKSQKIRRSSSRPHSLFRPCSSKPRLPSIHCDSLGLRDAKTSILADVKIVNVKYALGVVAVVIAEHRGRGGAQSEISALSDPVPVPMTVHDQNTSRMLPHGRNQIRGIDPEQYDALSQGGCRQ